MSTDSRTRWLAINYAITIFVSAFLLFQVQPLVSKYILPWFGGSPAVWTTCMLFFQTLLFGGYAYAHFVSERLPPKHQAILHLVVILTALVFLRVVPDPSWKPTDNTDPVGRILLLLSVSVGLPYFVLSTTGPLVQAWFARSFPGRSPYRLYALSNIGSLLALLSYPLVFERFFAAGKQADYWSWGFTAFAILCGGAAVWLWRAEGNTQTADGKKQKTNGDQQITEGASVEGLAVADSAANGALASTILDKPGLVQGALWLLLPAAASVALLATTNHLCTDVAVMPFLWVAPLALYLLTFVVAFDHPRWYRPGIIAPITLLAIYGAALGIGTTDLYQSGISGQFIRLMRNGLALLGGGSSDQYPKACEIGITLAPYMAIAFIAMFGICLLCHGELVRLRPHPRYLTGFYLMISAGGALGGVLVTLVAPHVFNTYFEWDLTLYFGFLLALSLLIRPLPPRLKLGWKTSLAAVLTSTAVLLLGSVGFIDLIDYQQYSPSGVVSRSRNFFGTLMVRDCDPDQGDHCVILKHGAITHGLQYAVKNRRVEPTTYYAEFAGVGRTINFFHELSQVPALGPDDEAHAKSNSKLVEKVRAAEDAGRLTHEQNAADAILVSNRAAPPKNESAVVGQESIPQHLRIGVVGLGAGTLAAYVRPGDFISFYEINDQVINIAESEPWFTFLSDCKSRGGQYDIRLGDARLTMERELKHSQPQHYDLLVLDAFSGDAIPAHLLTDQAFEIYLQHLATTATSGYDGAIAVHITNHYVDLEPVIRGISERFDLKMVRIECPNISDDDIFHSDWIILTRNTKLLSALRPFANIESAAGSPAKPAILWTDDKNNLFDVLK